MDKEKRVVTYARLGNYDQLENPIEYIVERAKQGEIKTLLVGTLERLCDDPDRRESLIKELTEYGVEIIIALDEEKEPRQCAIYNRHSVNDSERLTEMRGKLLTYCKENLGITDYILFEEIGSCLEKREAFDDMVLRVERGEFTDLLVYSIDRLFKPAYSTTRFWKIVKGLNAKVEIHVIKNKP